MKMFSKIGKLLLCGVAVAMIGCTDYDKDIQSVAGDVAQNATEIKNLDNAIKALEAKLSADYATKQELNAVKTALEGTIDTEVAALQAAIADAVKDLANAEDVAAVEASVKALQAAAADAAAAIEATDVKVGAIDERLTAVETAIEAIDEVAEQVLADVESLKNGYMETVAFAQQAQANIDALTEQTVDLEGQVAALEAMVDEMAGAFEERINTLGQTIGNLSNLLTDEVARLELADEEIYAKIEMVEGAVTAVNNLIGDLQTADEEIYVELNKALAYIGNVAALIEDEAAARANEDEQIYIQLNTVNETISAVITTVADLETRVAEVEDDLKAHVAAYEAYVAATEAKFQELLNTFASLSPVISTLQAQNAELKATLESLAPEIETINAKIAELKNQMTSLEPVIEALQGQTQELLSMLNSLAPVIDNIEAAIDALQSELRSIVIIPTVDDDVDFYTLQYIPMEPVTKTTLDDTVLLEENEDEEIFFTKITAPAYAYYHFNPSSFDVAKATYAVEEVVLTKAASEAYTVGGVKNTANGVQVQYNYDYTKDTDADLVALKATLENGGSIYSDYFAVEHHSALAAQEIAIQYNGKALPTTFEAAMAAGINQNINIRETLDITKNVKAVLANTDYKLDDYNFWFRFSAIPATHEYVVNGVNQQSVIYCEAGKYSVLRTENGDYNKNAIGFTPIVMVELMHDVDVVKRAYIKLQVTQVRNHSFDATFTLDEPVVLAKNGKTTAQIDAQWMSDNVFDLIKDYDGVQSMTRDEFYATYDYERYFMSKGGVNTNVFDHGNGNSAVVTVSESSTVPYVTSINHNSLADQLKYGESSVFAQTIVLVNKIPASTHPNYISLNVVLEAEKPHVYAHKATVTYAVSRLSFDLSVDAIVAWAKGLDLTNLSNIVDAAEAVKNGKIPAAVELMQYIPGFTKVSKDVIGVGLCEIGSIGGIEILEKGYAVGEATTDWYANYEALRKETAAKLTANGSDLDNLKKAIKVLEYVGKVDSNIAKAVEVLKALETVLPSVANYNLLNDLPDFTKVSEYVTYETVLVK